MYSKSTNLFQNYNQMIQNEGKQNLQAPFLSSPIDILNVDNLHMIERRSWMSTHTSRANQSMASLDEAQLKEKAKGPQQKP